MMRFSILILFVILFTHKEGKAQQKPSSHVLLELFTSQGCSSCPPADALLKELDELYSDQNIVVMSYHVDYWNRLGWRDPFSKKEFSDYQRKYATQFDSNSIYTPQLVVNGKEHFTGSDKSSAISSIKKHGSEALPVPIEINAIKVTDKEINFQYKITEEEEFDTITFVIVVKERLTQVGRGENRNKMLKNFNIVANRIVKTDPKGNISLAIPDWIMNKDNLSLIAYSQKKSLEITGYTSTQIMH